MKINHKKSWLDLSEIKGSTIIIAFMLIVYVLVISNAKDNLIIALFGKGFKVHYHVDGDSDRSIYIGKYDSLSYAKGAILHEAQRRKRYRDIGLFSANICVLTRFSTDCYVTYTYLSGEFATQWPLGPE